MRPQQAASIPCNQSVEFPRNFTEEPHFFVLWLFRTQLLKFNPVKFAFKQSAYKNVS